MKKRREIVNELIGVCESTMPGTRYDRFFLQEYVKKVKVTEDIINILNTMKGLTPSSNYVEVFEDLVQTKE